VMATVNGILAEHKVNVEAQLLGTRGEVGYVVTDISATYTDDMLDQLRALPETIRLRVLS
jgi:D-3-phosphoglycerate dehydrogenase / 2-oxoglutarate reductase